MIADVREVVVTPEVQAQRDLADFLQWPGEKVEAGVAWLTLEARDEFLKPPSGAARDAYPWLFQRQWSYNRRQFVRRGDELLWGSRQPIATAQLLYGNVTSGRYQALATTRPLRRQLGKLAKEAGAAFEARVAEVCRSAGLGVAVGVKHLGNARLERANGESLGDIDVLAADSRTRQLPALECKDLAGALTPADIAGELTNHFRTDTKTSVTKHAERVAWLTGRVDAALALLGLAGETASQWTVHALAVTGREVMAPYLEALPFDVCTIQELPAELTRRPAPKPRRRKRGKR
jgi:hypothetical protein